MGVGDRHSRRAVVDKARLAKLASSTSARAGFSIDERELDEPFSAWDEDDALAAKTPHPQTASSTTAQTRVGRKPHATTQAPNQPAPPPPAPDEDGAIGTLSDPLLKLHDPVALRDIVLARARTIDDPLTTRVLAEIARADAASERAQLGRADTVEAPAMLLTRARSTERTIPPSPAPDLIVTDPEPHDRANRRALLDADDDDADELRLRRRTTRQTILRAKDEPFRKK